MLSARWLRATESLGVELVDLVEWIDDMVGP